ALSTITTGSGNIVASMKCTVRWTACLAVLPLLVAACGPSNGSGSALTAAPLALAPGLAPPSFFGMLRAQSRDLGPIDPNRIVAFTVSLRNPGSQRQATALAAMYNPHSSSYGRYQTPQQVAASYGPRPADVRLARSYF